MIAHDFYYFLAGFATGILAYAAHKPLFRGLGALLQRLGGKAQ